MIAEGEEFETRDDFFAQVLIEKGLAPAVAAEFAQDIGYALTPKVRVGAVHPKDRPRYVVDGGDLKIAKIWSAPIASVMSALVQMGEGSPALSGAAWFFGFVGAVVTDLVYHGAWLTENESLVFGALRSLCDQSDEQARRQAKPGWLVSGRHEFTALEIQEHILSKSTILLGEEIITATLDGLAHRRCFDERDHAFVECDPTTGRWKSRVRF